MNDENLTAEQWKTIAEKLAKYLEDKVEDDFDFTRWSKDFWLKKAKKELGYE